MCAELISPCRSFGSFKRWTRSFPMLQIRFPFPHPRQIQVQLRFNSPKEDEVPSIERSTIKFVYGSFLFMSLSSPLPGCVVSLNCVLAVLLLSFSLTRFDSGFRFDCDWIRENLFPTISHQQPTTEGNLKHQHQCTEIERQTSD